jgi:UDP-N-acetylmuramate dehydrogenase
MKNAKYAKLLKTFPSIRQAIPLAPYTSFNIGGQADLFAEPKTQEEFIALITQAHQYGIRTFILGGGSNTLFSERGFRGFVIHPLLKKISAADHSITAEGGALLSQVIQAAVKNNLSGMENLIGLPGTVGGAVRGNAGAGGTEMKDIISSATLYDGKKNRVVEYSNEQLDFAYRHSTLKGNRSLIVLCATFGLKKSYSTSEQQKIMQEILKKRFTTQPKGKSAGCAFKNPTRISAGKLIDECGLKGLRVGGIEVSTTHGNFLQNVGGATQKNVLTAIRKIKQTVYGKRKIRLEEEIKIVPEK